MISKKHQLSLVKQCEVLNIARASFYYRAKPESQENLNLMKEIDKLYLKQPFLGVRRITDELQLLGYRVNHKRVHRLMRTMGIMAIYPKPNLSKANREHKIYPYLLRGLEIGRPNQVWATDITYIPMANGFVYLTAIMDWHSRKVLAWCLSNTMDVSFCMDALEEALHRYGTPEIFNSDQGSQYTSEAFTQLLKDHGINISMDGRGAWRDNVMVERLWRSVKYEEVYLNAYDDMKAAKRRLASWFEYYNARRKHQTLKNTPNAVYDKHRNDKIAA